MLLFRLLASVFLLAATFAPLAAQAEKPGKPVLKITRIEKELSAGTRYGFAMVKGHTRAGRKAQRFELRHGDCGGNKYWDDCSNDRLRIERKEDPKGRMQRVGSQVWYGWSFYLPDDFSDLGNGNVTIGQMKMKDWRTPLWYLVVRKGKLRLWQDDRGGCEVASLSALRGKWTDVVLYADYSLNPAGPATVLYLDGRKACTMTRPLITAEMLNSGGGDLYFKYGLYGSYVSRWLDRNKTRKVTAKPFTDSYARQNGATETSQSPTSRPFDYDWGVELPAQVMFYDEMRFGKSRAQVDIRMLEAAGIKPVD